MKLRIYLSGEEKQYLITSFEGSASDIGFDNLSHDEAIMIINWTIQGVHTLMNFDVLQEQDELIDFTIRTQIQEIFNHHNIALIQAARSIKTYGDWEKGKNHNTQNVAPFRNSNVNLGVPVSATDNITWNEHAVMNFASEFIKKAEETINLIYSELYQLIRKF